MCQMISFCSVVFLQQVPFISDIPWSQVYSHMGFSSMNHLTCCAATASVLENKKCYENISPGSFIFLGFRLVAWTHLVVIKVMLHKLKQDQISCLMTVSI